MLLMKNFSVERQLSLHRSARSIISPSVQRSLDRSPKNFRILFSMLSAGERNNIQNGFTSVNFPLG